MEADKEAEMTVAKGLRKGYSGFSLVEFLIIVIVIGVLVGIALPGFLVWLPTYRLNRATRDLISNFQRAKISAIKNHLNCTVNEATELTESLLEIIKNTLENGENVSERGFGKFSVREKKERRGNNPATSQALMLRARKIVTFKYSRNLRDKINND